MTYTITTNLIAGLPKTAYRNGVGKYEGVVAHSTATPEATAQREHEFESKNWKSAFVHYFVDWTQIIYNADINYKCWGAAATANARYVSVELCETKDPDKFQASYDRYVWLLAKILFDRKLGVTQCSTFWTHADVTNKLGGTTHQDPIDYLASHNVAIAQLVADVTKEYNLMANPPKAPVSPVQDSTIIGKVTVLVDDLYYYNKPDWNAKAGQVHKGDVFTIVQVLTVNDSKMYKLKSGNYLTANTKYVRFYK